jgi:hypothetical protein
MNSRTAYVTGFASVRLEFDHWIWWGLVGDQNDPNLDLGAGHYQPSMAIGDPHPGTT